MSIRERYDNLLQAALSDDQKLDAARGDRERYAINIPLGIDMLGATLEKRLPPSSTPISQRAVEMIITLEVSSENHYTAKYQSPIWPGVDSGVTIGIGYDIGYVNKVFFQDDWKDILPEDVIARLIEACGKKKQSAKELLPDFRDIQVAWQGAHDQFMKRTLPLYIADTEAGLKNTNLLPSDSLGRARVARLQSRSEFYQCRRNPPGNAQHQSAHGAKGIQQNFR